MAAQEHTTNKNKYIVNNNSVPLTPESTGDDVLAAESSINLEFASVESDERETYYSEESASKKPDVSEMYRSLQDEFVSPEQDVFSSPIHEKFSTPKESTGKSSIVVSSIHIYDASPIETIEAAREEDVFYRDEDDFDRALPISSLAFPMAPSDVVPKSQISSADETKRLESVLKRWQASVTDDAETENVGSPSFIVSQGDFTRKSPSLKFDGPVYPTFTEITFQEAVTACLGVSIQPSHYSASAVLRNTTTLPLTCCISAPANDSRAATDRALVFAIADWRYSETLPAHWHTLATIYSKMTGELNTVYRYGSHWEKIGFQGSDPITDLRSAGYLGLLHLLFLTTQATALAQQCYNLSIQPQGHFPLAITGLNLTRMVMSAIRSGRLKVEKNRASTSSGGRHHAASDRFLVASCKLYVSLWQNFATIWSSRHCTIENSHEVLQKLEKLATRQSNQLLKKSSCYLNGSYLLQQRSAMYAPVSEVTMDDRTKSPSSFSNSNSTNNAKMSSKQLAKQQEQQQPENNIKYTDISVL